MIRAKQGFQNYMNHLEGVKEDYQQMKRDNDLERAEMKRQEKQAAGFKFTKMSKKLPFFPTLNTRGFLAVEPVTSVDHGIPYINGGEREALLFPKKVKDFSKKFGLQKTCDGNFFNEQVGQQFDTYDEVLKKYMTTYDRGQPRPVFDTTSGTSIRIDKATTYLEGTKGVFRTTDNFPKLLNRTKPLLDRSNTPRKAFRLTSLDRNYTNERWLYNKSTCDDFNPSLIKRDVNRSKNLRRITRRENRQRSSSPTKKNEQTIMSER